MAHMTPSEGAAIDTVISYIASRDPDPPTEVVRALHALASTSSGRPQGGWDEHAVRRHWPAAFEDVQRAPADPADRPIEPDTPVNPA
jgi:hypothetical protein